MLEQELGKLMALSFVSLLNLTGTTVPAHRAILVARCEVMAAMFNGNYMEAKSVLIPVYGPVLHCLPEFAQTHVH